MPEGESGCEQMLMKARSLPMKGSENRCGFLFCNGGDTCAVCIPPERSDWAVKLMGVGSRASRRRLQMHQGASGQLAGRVGTLTLPDSRVWNPGCSFLFWFLLYPCEQAVHCLLRVNTGGLCQLKRKESGQSSRCYREDTWIFKIDRLCNF